MATTSLNPTAPSTGAYSQIGELIKDAMREIGESNPDVAYSVDSARYLIYANRVINDVNRHPYYFDLMRNRIEPMTVDMTSGDRSLYNVSAGNDALVVNTPVLIVGAGRGAADLTSIVNYQNTAGSFELMDEAQTTVSGAVMRSPYLGTIPRVTTDTDVRAIDDIVMLDGLKYYSTMDDADEGPTTPQQGQLYSTSYYQNLSGWLSGLMGAFGELEIQREDYGVFY